MNGIYFLPFIIVASFGIYQDATGEQPYYRGYDYLIVANEDGSYTTTFGKTPYLYDGFRYVQYINEDLTTKTTFGDVTLNRDGSYNFDGKFTDKIIAKYADISDLNNWTYLTTINTDVPDVSWSNGIFSSVKHRAGVGEINYKYTVQDGKWKTELEATNLSSLSTKAFGFDQIIEINTDMIKFGGVIRNLDNFHGQTFSKQFLDNNKGKILDFLDGHYFDFDLGYENLHSITIQDLGPKKTRLIFDYRTDTPLLPNETLIIDPTFGYSSATTSLTLRDTASATSVCGNLPIVSGAASANYIETLDSAISTYYCQLRINEWDTAIIPDFAIIDNVQVRYDITDSVGNPDCRWGEMDGQPSVLSDHDNWNYALNGTVYVATDTNCQTVTNDYVVDLGSSADTKLQSLLSEDYFAASTYFSVWSRPSGTSDYARLSNVELQVVWSAPAPDAVDDLSSPNQSFGSVDLLWTQPALNNGNASGYQINYTTPWGDPTTIVTNNTGTTDTSVTVSGLSIATDYSFRVSVWTEGGNNATGNILNVTTIGNFTIGSASFNQTNTQVLPITFEEQAINSTATFLNVTYANTYSLACDFYYQFANNNRTYTGLNGTAVSSTLDETYFIMTGHENEIININCYDTITGTDADYLMVQADFPLLQQIQNFRNGTYGTMGLFGIFDFVTIAVVIFSMIGLNRVNESVGAVFNVILLGTLSYFGIIELPTVIFGVLTVVIIFIITSTKKD